VSEMTVNSNIFSLIWLKIYDSLKLY